MHRAIRPLLSLTVAGLTLVGAGCGSSQSAISEPSAKLATLGSTGPSGPSGPSGASGPPAGCQSVPAPAPKANAKATPPSLKLDSAKTQTVQFQTNCGSFTVTLDAKRAPKTAASFASLAQQGFYDNLIFHRVDTGLGIVQGGDPQGSGQGGAGYSVVEKPPPGTTYSVGTVAMAKTGAEAAGTSGSQFFIVTGPQAAKQLTPDYALVGTVTQGLPVVQKMATVATDSSQKPTSPIVIQKATFGG